MYELTTVGDSFDALRYLSDGAADCVITDPPYSEFTQKNVTGGTEGTSRRPGTRVDLGFDPLSDWGFAAELVRVSKSWAVSFTDLESLGKYKQAVGEKRYVRSGIWYKTNSQGSLHADRPASACEGLAIMHSRRTKLEWNGRGSFGVWIGPGTRGEPDRHPNQKPLGLCLKLVALFTRRGESVLDPFCGSGRIGEACLLLGRCYFGWDQSAKWVAKAQERLSAVSFGSMSDEEALSFYTSKVPYDTRLGVLGGKVLRAKRARTGGSGAPRAGCSRPRKQDSAEPVPQFPEEPGQQIMSFGV